MIFLTKGEIKTPAGYFGKGMTIQLSQEEEKRLVSAGRAEPVYPHDLPADTGNKPDDPLNSMTVPELKDLAQRLNVDLKGVTSKAQIISAIQAEQTQE